MFVRNYGAASSSNYLTLFFLLFVASKGWWLEVEVVLSNFCCFIGFNLLIWSHSFGVSVVARSTFEKL